MTNEHQWDGKLPGLPHPGMARVSMTTGHAKRIPPVTDVPGLLALGAFVFSIPAIYLNTGYGEERICQVLAAAAIATNLQHFHPARVNLPMISLGALCGYFAVTAFGCADPEAWVSFSVWAKFVACSILLSFLVRTREQFLVVLAALASSAVFVTYASSGGLNSAREALDQAQLGTGGVTLVRSSGVFSNANTMAMYSIDAIIAGVTLYFSTRKLATFALCISSSASAAYLALYSGSRKAVLGIGVVVVFVVWLAVRTRRKAPLVTQVFALLLGVAGLAWLLANPYLVRFDTNDESYQMRAELIQEALRCVRANPLWGLGYHGFQHTSNSGAYTHSTPLEIMCNGGVVALTLYAILWWSLCRSLYRCIVCERDEKQKVLLYGIGCYLLVQAVSSLTSVVIEESRYLIVTACICGYLRSRELELRALDAYTRRRAMPSQAVQNKLLSDVGRSQDSVRQRPPRHVPDVPGGL